MLPQLVALADQHFLREFAATLFADSAFAESPEKIEVLSTLMQTLLDKIKFPLGDDSGDQSQKVKQLILDAINVGCGQLLPTVVKRIINVAQQRTSIERTRFVIRVLIPVLAFCQENEETFRQHIPRGDMRKLQLTTVQYYLAWLRDDPTRITRDTIRILIDIALDERDASTFINS